MGYRRTIKRPDPEPEGCQCPDCLLPADGPPRDLRCLAVPAWHGGSFEELEEQGWALESISYTKNFASGLETGLILANLRPEWARAFYFRLRSYYLITHTVEDLDDWDRQAAKVCQALPMRISPELARGARDP